MEKQFLAAWLNVQAYEDWVDPDEIGDFVGTADVGMDPNATVYLSGDAAALFGVAPMVMDILLDIETNKESWYTSGLSGNFKTAQGVLDMMNNAESNNYLMFMDPDFDPEVCPMELRENPPYKNTPLLGEDVVGSVVMVGDDTNDELVVFVYLDSGDLNSNYNVYLEEYTGTTGGTANWVDYDLIGNFTTDNHGHGSFYVRVPVAELDCAGPDYYLQIVLRQWYIFGTDIAEITVS